MTSTPSPDAFFDGLHMPKAEVDIDEDLIAALIAEQAPAFAALPVKVVDTGWDNVMARLGDDLAVRLPRRQLAVDLIRNEQRWLPLLAARLPLPVPSPLFCGVPNDRYPWPWSIVPWLDGDTADQSPLRADQVDRFCAFFAALHLPAPDDAPHNPFRACSLRDKAPGVQARFAALSEAMDEGTDDFAALGIDAPRTALRHWENLWNQSVDLAPAQERLWIAGDVHARNVIARDGALVGFIDFGDLTAGDRSTDLSSIWALFGDDNARAEAASKCHLTGDALLRAKGWAVFSGVTLLQTGLVDHPAHAKMGAAVLHRLLVDSRLAS